MYIYIFFLNLFLDRINGLTILTGPYFYRESRLVYIFRRQYFYFRNNSILERVKTTENKNDKFYGT